MGFFDRVKGTVEEAGKNIPIVASDNIEIVKCSSAIKTCEEKIREIYTEIGERYYKSETDMTREDFPTYSKRFSINRKKWPAEEPIVELEKPLICTACGEMLNEADAFCKNCGTPVNKWVI